MRIREGRLPDNYKYATHPPQTRLVPSGRREATEAGNRRPNFCRTVLAVIKKVDDNEDRDGNS
jgi:hypothetical protein